MAPKKAPKRTADDVDAEWAPLLAEFLEARRAIEEAMETSSAALRELHDESTQLSDRQLVLEAQLAHEEAALSARAAAHASKLDQMRTDVRSGTSAAGALHDEMANAAAEVAAIEAVIAIERERIEQLSRLATAAADGSLDSEVQRLAGSIAGEQRRARNLASVSEALRDARPIVVPRPRHIRACDAPFVVAAILGAADGSSCSAGGSQRAARLRDLLVGRFGFHFAGWVGPDACAGPPPAAAGSDASACEGVVNELLHALMLTDAAAVGARLVNVLLVHCPCALRWRPTAEGRVGSPVVVLQACAGGAGIAEVPLAAVVEAAVHRAAVANALVLFDCWAAPEGATASSDVGGRAERPGGSPFCLIHSPLLGDAPLLFLYDDAGAADQRHSAHWEPSTPGPCGLLLRAATEVLERQAVLEGPSAATTTTTISSPCSHVASTAVSAAADSAIAHGLGPQHDGAALPAIDIPSLTQQVAQRMRRHGSLLRRVQSADAAGGSPFAFLFAKRTTSDGTSVLPLSRATPASAAATHALPLPSVVAHRRLRAAPVAWAARSHVARPLRVALPCACERLSFTATLLVDYAERSGPGGGPVGRDCDIGQLTQALQWRLRAALLSELHLLSEQRISLQVGVAHDILAGEVHAGVPPLGRTRAAHVTRLSIAALVVQAQTRFSFFDDAGVAAVMRDDIVAAIAARSLAAATSFAEEGGGGGEDAVRCAGPRVTFTPHSALGATVEVAMDIALTAPASADALFAASAKLHRALLARLFATPLLDPADESSPPAVALTITGAFHVVPGAVSLTLSCDADAEPLAALLAGQALDAIVHGGSAAIGREAAPRTRLANLRCVAPRLGAPGLLRLNDVSDAELRERLANAAAGAATGRVVLMCRIRHLPCVRCAGHAEGYWLDACEKGVAGLAITHGVAVLQAVLDLHPRTLPPPPSPHHRHRMRSVLPPAFWGHAHDALPGDPRHDGSVAVMLFEVAPGPVADIVAVRTRVAAARGPTPGWDGASAPAEPAALITIVGDVLRGQAR